MAGAMGRSQRRRTKGGPAFVQLYRFIKRSQAWHDLSLPARCALLELLDRYNGINNGMIGLGVRELASALRCSRGGAAKALRELDDAGLARPITGGHWKGKRATEWRLTFYVCHKTGELPIRSWPARQVSTHEATEVHPQGHKAAECPPTRTHNGKSSMNDHAKCPPTRPHIDIYHTGMASADGAPDNPNSSKKQKRLKRVAL